MLMADTMAVFFVILGVLLALPGLWLLCRGLWPRMVAETAAVCRKGLLKPFVAGLPLTVVLIFVAAALSNFGTAGKIAAMALVCVYLVWAHCGVAGLATSIGARLASPGDAEREWRATLRGGVVLELAYLLPVLGWFLLLPVSITIGCGAALIALLKKLFATATVAAPPPMNAAQAEAASFRVAGNLGAER